MKLRKRRNRKHAGRSLWTFPLRFNLDGSIYWACQYVTDENGKERTITRGLGRGNTRKYQNNLTRYEEFARTALIRRLLAAIYTL